MGVLLSSWSSSIPPRKPGTARVVKLLWFVETIAANTIFIRMRICSRKNHMPAKKPVWAKPRPESAGKPRALTPQKKTAARRAAESAGRPYPNLVDNMRAARRSK